MKNSIIINLFLYLFLIKVINSEITAEWKKAIEKYSPLIWLESEETNFPGKVEDMLPNVKPIVGGTSNKIAPGAPDKLTIYNLNFATPNPKNVYLTSIDDPTVDPQPSWMIGTKPREGAMPPIYTIFVDKGVDNNGKVQADVFYFTWYLFNLGSEVSVINEHMGNHVGDWEYFAVRLVDYNPTEVFLSQHSNGGLYSPNLIEKTNDGRFVIYSARGNHALYTTANDHCIFKLVTCIIKDFTSQGTAWNTWENLQIIEYHDVFSSGKNPDPLAWLNYQGYWGNQALPDNDPRQKDYFSFKKWVEGPDSPIDKGLKRDKLCQKQNDCNLITN